MLFHSVQLNPQELQSARDLAALTHVKSYNQVLPSNPQIDLKKALDNL
jgi:PTS system mannose-specific IIB component